MKPGKRVWPSRMCGLILQQIVLLVELKCLKGIESKNFVEEHSLIYLMNYALHRSDIKVTDSELVQLGFASLQEQSLYLFFYFQTINKHIMYWGFSLRLLWPKQELIQITVSDEV
jgi:hypothetical protein